MKEKVGLTLPKMIVIALKLYSVSPPISERLLLIIRVQPDPSPVQNEVWRKVQYCVANQDCYRIYGTTLSCTVLTHSAAVDNHSRDSGEPSLGRQVSR